MIAILRITTTSLLNLFFITQFLKVINNVSLFIYKNPLDKFPILIDDRKE